jgi:AcrR family transcriptional regulator
VPTTLVPNTTGRPDIIPEAADARQRLLKAALQLFSEQGFDATGVRDLANAAGVNLGALNYYFDSKENLRLEAFRYGFAPALQMRTDTQNYLDEAQRKSTIPAAEEALRKYIRRFLDDILAVNSGNWSLLMRELTMPSPAFEIVVHEYFEPQNAILIGILRLLLPRADETTLDCCVGSIMGQCYEVRNTAPIVRSTRGIDTSGADYVKRRADHITDFSLLALRGLRQGHPKARRRS